MATFGEIKTAVSKRLLDPNNVSITSSDVANAINDSIAYWKFRKFWFNSIKDTVTLTEHDGNLPVTGDFLVSTQDDDGFNIEYSGMRYPLQKVSQQVFDNIWLSTGYGIPVYYARVNNTYQMYPLPDRAYDLNRHYLKEYSALTSDSQTNDFTNYASVLIRNWTLADLVAEFEQDDKMEAYYRARADNEYRQLTVMTDKVNGAGKLTIDSVLYS
jgi:hypothetical protein